MAEKNVKLMIGDGEAFTTITAPIPADDQWHDVELHLKVRKSADGEYIWLGPNGGHIAVWLIDGNLA